MSVNFIERYFYLVCFATYALEEASSKSKSFSEWMNDHDNLRSMIKSGMAEFNWV